MSPPLKKPKPNLIYALDANGKPVHIDSVPNGFSCGCKCPRCESPLQAKNGGNERAHHFAHKDGADCVGAVESAIHCLAKEILKESLCVVLPDNAGGLRFDKVETERIFPDLKLRPDCVGYYGDRIIWIEFKRSHEVDAQKAGKIVSARIDCIEIDLKDCEQDKEKLREFITQSSENRKWIYSEQYGIGLAEHASFERNSQKKDEVDTDDEKVVRHFAIDDVGRLIDFRVPAEFDANKHSYCCPNCGKEVFLNVDDNSNYSFAHVTEDSSCDDEMYLRSAAVAAIHQAFVDSPKFIIEVPQYRSCKQAEKCPCNQGCKAPTTQQYDLKAHRYLKCEKDYKFSDVPYRTDLVFYRDAILKDSIEVRVNTENFDLELETPRRLIDVTVHNEKDICQLEKGLNGFENVRFMSFNQESKEKAEPREIQNEVLKYTVYASGKIHIGSVKCTEIHSSHNRTNILREGVFTKTTGFIDDMYVFLLFRYKVLWKNLCLCRLCCYLKVGWNGEYICSRYKTVGMPRNPLNENNPPKECAFFRMNYNIQNQESALNEEMEIVEL